MLTTYKSLIMNKNLIFKGATLVLFLLLNVGCGKLDLLKNESPEAIDAGSSLKDLTFADFLAQDHSQDRTNLNMYADAIKMAGLIDLLNQQEDLTLLFFTNQAVTSLVTSLGYATLTDVPKAVLRNILSDNIFKGRVRSFDLQLDETKKYETINGSFLYFTRTGSSSNNYIFKANSSNELSSPAATIRSQNLQFKNGVAHVTDQFTFYKQLDIAPDAPSGGVGSVTDTFYVSKDVFVKNGNANKNKNFNSPTTIELKNTNGKDITVDRTGLFQFPLNAPSFGRRIGLAKLNFYVYFTGLPSSLSIYQAESTDFDENTVSFVTKPAFNQVSIANASLSSGFVGWQALDVTAVASQLYADNQTRMNVIVNSNTDSFVRIYPYEYLAGKFASFLTVSSPPESILTLGTLKPLTVKANSITVLNTDNLKMAGTADKNISFTINKVPMNGYLVKYGVPLPVNSSFSQADLIRGAIKYLHNGSGSTDELEVEAKDNNGGYFKDPLKVIVNIQK